MGGLLKPLEVFVGHGDRMSPVASKQEGKEPMRKLLLGVAAMPLLGLGLGCHSHVGGQCDCAAVPGDSVNHNPHVSYHAGSPVVTTPSATVHGTTISNSKSAPITVIPPSTGGNTFESIAAPKPMPPK